MSLEVKGKHMWETSKDRDGDDNYLDSDIEECEA
jgi:hypothetical protein